MDLAGSECIGRSGAIEKRAREAGRYFLQLFQFQVDNHEFMHVKVSSKSVFDVASKDFISVHKIFYRVMFKRKCLSLG